MKCDIIKDLLPLYADNLTSEASNAEIKEHLESCEDCSLFYSEMQRAEKAEIHEADDKEIDFLRKIKRGRLKTAASWAGIAVIVMLVLVKMFVIGFKVNSEDMEMLPTVQGRNYVVEFNLTNGHDLIMRSSNSYLREEDNGKVSWVHEYNPNWVFNNPFDDVGSSFSLGGEYDGSGEYTDRVVIHYADKDVELVNDKMAE